MQSIRVQHTNLGGNCFAVQTTICYAPEQSADRHLTVLTPACTKDGGAIAELTALYHYLCERAVFGDSRSGKDLRVVVSMGVIRKLFQQRSSKRHLLPYAQFLVVRFAEACVQVDNRSATLSPPLEAQVIDAGHGNHEHWPTCAGYVVLTRHAIERYAQKVHRDGLDQSWHRLVGLLVRGQGCQVDVDNRGRRCERWRFATGNQPPLTVVVARELAVNKVVTVYP